MSLISSIGSLVKKNPLVLALSLAPMLVSSLLGKDDKTPEPAAPPDGFDPASPVAEQTQLFTAEENARAQRLGEQLIAQNSVDLTGMNEQVNQGLRNRPITG